MAYELVVRCDLYIYYSYQLIAFATLLGSSRDTVCRCGSVMCTGFISC